MPPHEREDLVNYLEGGEILAPGLLLLLSGDSLWQQLEQEENFRVWEEATLQGERWAIMLWEGLRNSFQKESDLGVDENIICSRVVEGFLGKKGSNKSNWETAQDEFIDKCLVMGGFEFEVEELRQFVDRKKQYGDHTDHDSSTKQVREALGFFEKNGWKGQVVRVITHGNNQINDGYVMEVMTGDGKGRVVYSRYDRVPATSEPEGEQTMEGLRQAGRVMVNQDKSVWMWRIQIANERDYIKWGEIPDSADAAVSYRRTADTDAWVEKLRREEAAAGDRGNNDRLVSVNYVGLVDHFSRERWSIIDRQLAEAFLAWQQTEMQRLLKSESSDEVGDGSGGGENSEIIWQTYSYESPSFVPGTQTFDGGNWSMDFSWFAARKFVHDVAAWLRKPVGDAGSSVGVAGSIFAEEIVSSVTSAQELSGPNGSESGEGSNSSGFGGDFGAGANVERRGVTEAQKTHEHIVYVAKALGNIEEGLPTHMEGFDVGDDDSGEGGNSGSSTGGFGGGSEGLMVHDLPGDGGVRSRVEPVIYFSPLEQKYAVGDELCLDENHLGFGEELELWPTAHEDTLARLVLKGVSLLEAKEILMGEEVGEVVMQGESRVHKMVQVFPILREQQVRQFLVREQQLRETVPMERVHQQEMVAETMVVMESGVIIPKVVLSNRRADAALQKASVLLQSTKIINNMHYGLVCYVAILYVIEQLTTAVSLAEQVRQESIQIPKIDIVKPQTAVISAVGEQRWEAFLQSHKRKMKTSGTDRSKQWGLGVMRIHADRVEKPLRRQVQLPRQTEYFAHRPFLFTAV